MPAITWITDSFGVVMYDKGIEVVRHEKFASSFDEALMYAKELEEQKQRVDERLNELEEEEVEA